MIQEKGNYNIYANSNEESANREKEKENLQKISQNHREDTKRDKNAVNQKRKRGNIQGKDGAS